MFKSQFKLNSHEDKSFREITIYIIRHHIKAWFRCGYAIEALHNDLSFMKSIYRHRTIVKETSNIAIAKFTNHLWYLSDEAILFALFDNNASFEEKRKMTHNLMEYIRSNTNESNTVALKKYALNSNQIEHFVKMNLHDFITPSSMEFFNRFNISVSFLASDPSTWEHNDSYNAAKERICKVSVVNDNAERGVKLMGDFNQMTRDENDTQFLLQVVSEYRKRYPKYTKTSLEDKFDHILE